VPLRNLEEDTDFIFYFLFFIFFIDFLSALKGIIQKLPERLDIDHREGRWWKDVDKWIFKYFRKMDKFSTQVDEYACASWLDVC
jgi:hypothetical protein